MTLPDLQAEGIIDKVKHAVGLGSEKTEEAKQYASDAANTASKQVSIELLPLMRVDNFTYREHSSMTISRHCSFEGNTALTFSCSNQFWGAQGPRLVVPDVAAS